MDSPVTIVNIQELTTLRLRRDCFSLAGSGAQGQVGGARSGALVQVLEEGASEGLWPGAVAVWRRYNGQFQKDTGALRRVRMQIGCMCMFLSLVGCVLGLVNKS